MAIELAIVFLYRDECKCISGYRFGHCHPVSGWP
jgi:hypothetical protein